MDSWVNHLKCVPFSHLRVWDSGWQNFETVSAKLPLGTERKPSVSIGPCLIGYPSGHRADLCQHRISSMLARSSFLIGFAGTTRVNRQLARIMNWPGCTVAAFLVHYLPISRRGSLSRTDTGQGVDTRRALRKHWALGQIHTLSQACFGLLTEDGIIL